MIYTRSGQHELREAVQVLKCVNDKQTLLHINRVKMHELAFSQGSGESRHCFKMLSVTVCTSHRHGECVFSSVVLQFAGELRACVCAGRPWKPSIERGIQNLIQVSGRDKVEFSSDVGWQLLQVFLVTFWQNDSLHSCPVGRQDLVFDPAHL